VKTVNIHSAKTNFSKLLSDIEEHGESYVICRNGHPVAQLNPLKVLRDISPDPILSNIEINYDPTEEMSEEEWPRES